MNDQLNNGKGFLKDKLGGYQVDPPEKVWDSIASELGGRSRRGMIIIALSVAATLALAVTLGINYFGPEVHEDAVIAGAAVNTDTTVDADKGAKEAVIADTDVKEALIADTDAKETGRETLEEKVVAALEKIATEEIATEKPAMEKPATEEPAIREMATNELAVHVGAETATDQIAIALQTDEVAGSEPTADPVPDMDVGGKKDPRWIIGAALSPLYSFRDAEATAMNGAVEHESGLLSYAAGVHVGYRTTPRLAIESGVFFTKMGIAIGAPGIQLFSRSLDESFDFAPLGAEASRSNVVAISNSVGNIVSKSGDIYVNNYKLNASTETNAVVDYSSSGIYADQGIKQHLNYLELPFNLRYTVVDRDIELQLVGGMSTNFLVDNYVTMETSDGPVEIGYLTNIRNINYSGNAGLGVIYHIQEQFSLYLEPRFRYFLNSVNDATLPNTRPYTFGVFTGLSYTF